MSTRSTSWVGCLSHDGPVVVLPTDPRPRPTVDKYDQLLSQRFRAMAADMDGQAG